MSTLLLLVMSNVFMTFAWYGHLKYGHDWPLWKAILVSWGIALFEKCCLAVPANRLGFGQFSNFQLKIIQEVVTLVVFIVFAITFLEGKSHSLDYLVAFVFLGVAAFSRSRSRLRGRQRRKVLHWRRREMDCAFVRARSKFSRDPQCRTASRKREKPGIDTPIPSLPFSRSMPYWSTLYLASEWTIRFVMLVYVPQQRTSAAARTWLLLIFLLPWPGLIVYALLGRIRVPRARVEQQMLASHPHRTRRRCKHKRHLVRRQPVLPSYLEHIPALVAQLGDFSAFSGNAVELLPDYTGSIARLVADIEAAKDHVHLLTYILAPDATGEAVASALVRAVRRGVQCRLMADAVGSRPGLEKLAAELRREGVEVIPMLRVGFFPPTMRRDSICGTTASFLR